MKKISIVQESSFSEKTNYNVIGCKQYTGSPKYFNSYHKKSDKFVKFCESRKTYFFTKWPPFCLEWTNCNGYKKYTRSQEYPNYWIITKESTNKCLWNFVTNEDIFFKNHYYNHYKKYTDSQKYLNEIKAKEIVNLRDLANNEKYTHLTIFLKYFTTHD